MQDVVPELLDAPDGQVAIHLQKLHFQRVLQLQRLYLRTKVGECLGDVEAQILMCTALARIQGLQLCDEDGYDSLTHSHGVETERTRL